jgi:hypothetical protein
MATIRVVSVNDSGLRIGQYHPRATLTDSEVENMRRLHENDRYGYGRLAKLFEVTKSTVAAICTYRRRADTIARWKTIRIES